MAAPEDQLLARCRTGDADAFGCVYAQYSPLVFRCAYSILGHYEDARDVSQETFVRAYQALGGFQAQCSLRTWLLSICSNLCRDRRRRKRCRQEVSLDGGRMDLLPECAARPGDPHADLERKERARTVWSALAALPDGQREIIYLRDVEELSVDEVMKILGCTRVNVNVKLFRARKRLRESVTLLLEDGKSTHE